MNDTPLASDVLMQSFRKNVKKVEKKVIMTIDKKIKDKSDNSMLVEKQQK